MERGPKTDGHSGHTLIIHQTSLCSIIGGPLRGLLASAGGAQPRERRPKVTAGNNNVILVFGIKFEQNEVEEWMWVCAWSMFLDIFVQQPLSTGFSTFIQRTDLLWPGMIVLDILMRQTN